MLQSAISTGGSIWPPDDSPLAHAAHITTATAVLALWISSGGYKYAVRTKEDKCRVSPNA